MNWLGIVAGTAFFGSAVLVVATVRGVQRPRRTRPVGQTLRDLLPTLKEGDEQNLRLVGITPEKYAVQRTMGLVGGLVAGVLIGLYFDRGPAGTVFVVAAATAGGWFLPMLGLRDTASRTRAEIDQVVRVWISLVAQQVSAGVDPTAAMLAAARMGRRQSWDLLHRFLLAAQQERRPVWEGLVEVVERYGVHGLTPVVSALGLAAERGTRLSDAILVSADTLWRESTAREREKAARRAQVIVVPATGVALALAVILIYPPFASLTGGVVAMP